MFKIALVSAMMVSMISLCSVYATDRHQTKHVVVEHQTGHVDDIIAQPIVAQPIVAQGIVKLWNNNFVIIDHNAVPELNWRAMTMKLIPHKKLNSRRIEPETHVDFAFQLIDNHYQLLEIEPIQSQ